MKRILITLNILFVFLFGVILKGEEARLLRFPTVFEKQVVFSYAGDLYSVSAEGGTARKLTTHPGYEMFPRFSHDGKWLAFTAQYDGNTEVYLMKSQGGVPQRLTYTAFIERDDVSDRMGPNNIVMGWKHDNQQIVFRSRMIEPNDFLGQLFTTTIKGDMHQQLPLPRGGFCSFSEDDSQLAYNRVFREFRTWKRYRGGMADDIWIYNFKTKKIKNITNHPAQDIIPMWKDHQIFFLSDRGKYERMNLYVYNQSDETIQKLTDFKEYDIKFPSMGKNQIAFENGGYIYLYNINSNQLKKISIHINDDRLHARGGIRNVRDNITNYDISPDGKRALFVARGDVFTVPAKNGNTRNITQSPGFHDRDAQWSPDGKWIAFISDITGENEIYILPQKGGSQPIQITAHADTYKYEFKWSPDGKKILWGDRKLRLRYVNIQSKKIVEVFQSQYNEPRDFDWSPDSEWIVYNKAESTDKRIIYLYSLKQGKSFQITDLWNHSHTPCFSSCGKFLFFISDRDFNPIMDNLDFNFLYQDMQRIYMVPLAKETLSPFQPQSDEVEEDPSDKIENSTGKNSSNKKVSISQIEVSVDIDGIKNRIEALPIQPAEYDRLVSVGNQLFYLRKGSSDENPIMLAFDLKKQKETELGPVDDFVISKNGKKMLVVKNEAYSIIDLPSGKLNIKDKLNLNHLEVNLCLKSEWKNIFHECWRQMRDFFYVVNMHGIDWEKMKKRYEPLLKHVNHRNDLTYVIGEMISELNVGHAYILGGERPKLKSLKIGLLGAQLQRDSQSNFYKIVKILKGQNWNKERISPLTVNGVKAHEGDYIIEVNGKSTAKMPNIYQSLVNTVDQQVHLVLNSVPSKKGSWETIVVPIGNEAPLYYYNWILDNTQKVNQATKGKVGYIHIPDMGVAGLNEFAKQFFPQMRKKALIIDVRGNGGGFVSQWIIERLRREIMFIRTSNFSPPHPDPHEMMYGPLVCLCNEFSASDGDIFPYRFKKHQLGKLIGKRTWGGTVGIRGSLPLLDGGKLFKPEFSFYTPDGKEWVVEGHGVDPDIVIDNDPAQEFSGIDQQLNKAIEVILEELKTKEKFFPKRPPDPDKSIKDE